MKVYGLFWLMLLLLMLLVFMQMKNGWGGYPKAVVPSPTIQGYVWSLLTIVPTLYLVSSLMEERVDVGVVNLLMVGPSMRLTQDVAASKDCIELP